MDLAGRDGGAQRVEYVELEGEPSGAAVAGAMLCTGWQEPLVTLATSSRTWGATERKAASTPAQVAGGAGT